MSKKLSLFIVPGNPESGTAQEKLKTAFPKARIKLIGVPAIVERYYHCPFVRKGKGGAYYGLRGIEAFIILQKEKDSSKKSARTKKRKVT